MEDASVPKGFRKKVYTKLTTSELTGRVSDSISQISEAKGTKIIPTQVSSTLRGGFKQLFLPVLIDIFELRQSVANCKNQAEYEKMFEKSLDTKCPEQILEKLQMIQKQVEEAKNWCDSVTLQLGKGICEAKELLGQKCHEQKGTSRSFLKAIANLFQRTEESE